MLTASVVVSWAYMALPVAGVVVAMQKLRRQKSAAALRAAFSTCLSGAAAGLLLALFYLRAYHGFIPIPQILVTVYWGVAVAWVIRGVATLLAWVGVRVSPVGSDGMPKSFLVDLLVTGLRAAAMLAFLVACVGGMLLLYRPRVLHPGTPTTLLGADFQAVQFNATDGVELAAWWIPAAASGNAEADASLGDFGTRTVILCHGFGADKASALRFAGDLIASGYNVLDIDLRAHGESSGQFITFGDLERRDVLGAIRWVRSTHSEQCRKIFGLGESLGAAALVSAAADPTDGQYLDAIAVFSPFDRLTSLVQDFADVHYAPSAGWLATHVAMPFAGGQLGTHLMNFAPVEDVQKLAPRPILVIATDPDPMVEVSPSENFYDRASQPKYVYWVPTGKKHEIRLANEKSAITVRLFFARARQVL